MRRKNYRPTHRPRYPNAVRKCLGNSPDAFGCIHPGGVLGLPHRGGSSIARKHLEPGERRAAIFHRLDNYGYHQSFARIVPFQRSLHLFAPAILGGDKIRTNQ